MSNISDESDEFYRCDCEQHDWSGALQSAHPWIWMPGPFGPGNWCKMCAIRTTAEDFRKLKDEAYRNVDDRRCREVIDEVATLRAARRVALELLRHRHPPRGVKTLLAFLG